MALTIGRHKLSSPLFLAPMAGASDFPFRQICREQGAGLCTSEMLIADRRLWNSQKSSTRLPIASEEAPRSVQIAGSDPEMLADAAKACVDLGAQIVDINMGCPAKKVCNRAAGSALLQDEKLVEQILSAVVSAVDVPVTLKTRTGWDPENRNGVKVAQIAEESGVALLTIHGRTRACKFNGDAEYETIAEIVNSVSIPVIANGDIDSAEKALNVLAETKAAGLMLGRGAQGNPWLFSEIRAAIGGLEYKHPSAASRLRIIEQHLNLMYRYYDELLAVRLARKHISWYLSRESASKDFMRRFNQLDNAQDQLKAVGCWMQNKYNLPINQSGLAA